MAKPERVQLLGGPCDGAMVVPLARDTLIRFDVIYDNNWGHYILVHPTGEYYARYVDWGGGYKWVWEGRKHK